MSAQAAHSQATVDEAPAAAPAQVVIGYDCRRMSAQFALEAGQVLAAAGIKAYVFEHLCPTPELSYAVRELGAQAGIMITASHNPPEYNGYKLYGPDGGQILPEVASAITHEIASINDVFGIASLPRTDAEKRGLLVWLGRDLDERYYEAVVSEVVQPHISLAERAELRVVYSPLHGTGNLPVQEVLKRAGYSNVFLVASQEQPDGEFPTVKSPNPEEPEAFVLALQQAREVGADVVLATDPDADRVGVAALDEAGDYHLFTGNQTGGLLLDFLIGQREWADRVGDNAIVLKTIVTSDLGAAVARAHGIAVEDTLTGFKYIGDKIRLYEENGEKQFFFGYEESYGYLISPTVRDKDAVQSCLAIAEMAAYYKQQGRTLLQALQNLYERVGYFREELMSVTLPGVQGLDTIQAIMRHLRVNSIAVEGLSVAAVEDYQTGWRSVGEQQERLTLPSSDVLKYVFENGTWLAVRPSGTEPKIKFYLGSQGRDLADCETQLLHMRTSVKKILDSAQTPD
ncbi:MAG: hypothetical protein A2201_02025 [Alicyclobacillus sp. RIFOXYA1_FULL_53_8]|nr:MAG: hypothetical protein A2201_02025 [Alicyclobacillus sp. RIFOXYA1_FULL_53_8]